MNNLADKTLMQIRDLLAAGEVKVQEAVKACLTRISSTESRIKALISLDSEQALKQAKQMDKSGPDPEKPLWGVPITIKDVICTRDFPTTCGSKMLENFKPGYDATLVRKLRQAGALILGKNNMDEFAMGSSTENSAFKITANPWNTDMVPGGSSGGSAASVASGQCFASIGTDTGGSIRQPASFCGITGVKPTYGRVPS